MVDSTDEFVKRLKTAGSEARLRRREPKTVAFSRPKKDQKQIPISLFYDMFGRGPKHYAGLLARLKTR